MKLKIKFLAIKITRFFINILHIFPIQRNKVIFISFDGKQVSCSPFYIYKELIKQYPTKYKCIWVRLKGKEDVFREVMSIKYGSFSFIYNMMTAGCVITNDTLPTYLKFSKEQVVINTWHGGGLFKQTFGNCTADENIYNDAINKIHNSDTKLFTLSGKAWHENVVIRRFGYTGNILKCGMPRNDVFFYDNSSIVVKIKEHYSIPAENGIVLYAPTFRSSMVNGNINVARIDVLMVLESLKKKYKKDFTFIFRGHHLLSMDIDGCINASNYPDMQELLASADVFISDFSSCLWDYSLTKRPCFIYAPDFDEYAIKPGFESDYTEWPFLIARDNSQLANLIVAFDSKKYSENCDRYHKSYGSYENGNASKEVVSYIVKKLM